MKPAKQILPIIVFSQFCCTSLWFAGNAVMPELYLNFNLNEKALGHLTSAVQFGFILGTLIFAFLSLADRFSPSKLFFISAVFGSIFNLGVVLENNNLNTLLLLRFLTGFSLAGIYPVGMKLAADYYNKGLGKSLGYLVGALVLGTAFPHFLKTFTGMEDLPWRWVIIATSLFAFLGGLLILLFVPNGPFRKAKGKFNFNAVFRVFGNKKLRSVAFGYFGHMWELYTFWAFVPIILATHKLSFPTSDFDVPFWSFIIIGIGGLSCVAGGYISEVLGVKKTATTALLLSGICCIAFPFIFLQASAAVLISFLCFWGVVVIADSPLFSTLVASNAPPEIKGTALTIVNSIGFAITIVSLQLINYLHQIEPVYSLSLLAIGPALGLFGIIRKH
ncbi:Predicted arabinose efflux permease, MFS family [Salegentibacter holothuriorum]|uniref:Predicted arabinose efflux permease, MFS family n=1 Tax=Salegentibacter holothuriorum TaxID=241145 RepID=A0A1T5D7U9_9FLAO|nr:MFS transporter [Salegentibacter holothuriorum]SKB67613.1 Predicted arabinose efflux permease, MFS family [Salegentibacter holothuriorum]